MRLKVKLFGFRKIIHTTFSGKDSIPHELEYEINQWLVRNPRVDIVDIKQSQSGCSMFSSRFVISIWYRDVIKNKE